MPYVIPPIESWSDWTAVFDDLRVWRPVVDSICERAGVSYRGIETPRSNTNAVFILDSRLVVKIYSPFWPEFDIEGKLLEVLGRSSAVPVPTVVASGVYEDRVPWSYLVMEHRQGATLESIRPKTSRDDLLGIAFRIGLVIRELHQTDVAPFDDVGGGESWDDLVDRRRREVVPELVDGGFVSPGVAMHLAGILDDAIACSEGAPRVVVHGDLESDHILLERADGKWEVSALIDFGDAEVAVRDYEWMPLWLGLFDRDVEAMRAFLAAYDPSLLADDSLPRRIMAWTLLHDFGTDAVAHLFEAVGQKGPVDSLDALRGLLWPGLTGLTGDGGAT